MNLDATIQYLTVFFRAHASDYRDMVMDAKPSQREENFLGENDVHQGLWNILGNIEDKCLNLSVPEAYATAELLHEYLVGLRDLANRQLSEAENISANPTTGRHRILDYSLTMNREVRDAVDHAISLSASSLVKEGPIQRLNRIAARLPAVAHQLLQRRKENEKSRPTLRIRDEYDVQDLLHAVLKLDFDDIRQEEYCPSYASSSKRVDFLLKSERIFVEVKKTRRGLDRKKLSDELIIDIASYKTHADCSHLFCLVWDTSKIVKNSTGLKADLESSNKGFVTVAIVS